MGAIGGLAVLVLIIGIVALRRGHLTWARIHNRRTAGIVTGVAGVVLVTAVALDPPPPAPVAAPVTTTPPAPTVSSTAAPAPPFTTTPSTTTPVRTTTVAPATMSTSTVPPTTTTTTPSAPPALPPLASARDVLCRVNEGSGTVYVSITSAVQHNFDACAGGQRLPDQDLQSAMLAGGSTVDRRCVSSNDDVRRDDAIIGVYASSRSVDIAAARTFCTAHSILGNS